MIFQVNMECAQRLENTGPHRGEGFQMFCLPSKNNTLFDWYKPKTSICLFLIEARTRKVQPVYKVMSGAVRVLERGSRLRIPRRRTSPMLKEQAEVIQCAVHKKEASKFCA